MKRPFIDRPVLRDPLYDQRNPYQTFLLVISLVVAAPLLVGKSSGSRTLAIELDDATLLTWGLCLLVGSTIALVGGFWRGRTWDGLVLERTGVGLVGIGCLFYAAVVYFTAETNANFAVGVTGAYGLSCMWRFVQITHRLIWLRGLVAQVNDT